MGIWRAISEKDLAEELWNNGRMAVRDRTISRDALNQKYIYRRSRRQYSRCKGDKDEVNYLRCLDCRRGSEADLVRSLAWTRSNYLLLDWKEFLAVSKKLDNIILNISWILALLNCLKSSRIDIILLSLYFLFCTIYDKWENFRYQFQSFFINRCSRSA